MTARRVVALWAALAACASQSAPVRATAPLASRATPLVPARVFVQGAIDREHNRVCVTVEGDDGAERMLRAGVREEIREGTTRRAAVRLAGAPDLVFHDAAGWHFFSARNRWRAATFLGEPEQVQRLRRGVVGRGVGRPVALRDGAIEGMDVPGTVMDAAFVDDRTGVAVVEPGVALFTEDGGATWRPLRVDDALTDVLATPAGVFVEGRNRWRLDAGASIAAGGAFPERRWCPSNDEAGSPEVPDVGDEAQPQRLDPGLRWADDARTAVVLDARGTRYDLIHDRFEQAPDPPCEQPQPVSGSAFAAVCAGDHERLTAYGRGGGGPWRALGVLRRCGAACVASHDGRRVACEGRCDPAGECDGVSTVCELSADGPPRERRYGDGRRRFTPLGYDGAALVVLDGRPHLSHAEFARGDEPPRRLCPGLDAPRLTREFSQYDPPRLEDGVIALTASNPALGWGRYVVMAAPGAPCAVREETLAEDRRRRPDDTPGRWALACGRGGRALAFHDDEAWVRDAAEGPWRRLETSLPGVDRAWLRGRLRDGDVECGEAGYWVADGEVAVIGWGAPATARRTLVGEPDAPREHAFTAMPTEWRCAVSDAAVQLPAPPPRPQGAGRGDVVLGRQRLWIAVPTQAPDGLPGHRFAGFDPRGFTTGDEQVHWATRPERSEALVGATDFEGERFTLWRVSERAPAVRLGEVDTETYASGDVRSATADGVTALLWEGGMGMALHTRVELLRVEGRRLQRSSVPLSRTATDALLVYVLRGEAGVARLRDDGSLVGGAPGEAPRSLARAGDIGSCGSAAEGAASGIRRVRLPDAGSWENVELDLAFEGDRLCLRGARGVFLGARFDRGALVVTRARDAGAERWTCRPPQPRP
ncbi:MAG: hypothetical protein U0324_00175 [Polyangiales bacterium]